MERREKPVIKRLLAAFKGFGLTFVVVEKYYN